MGEVQEIADAAPGRGAPAPVFAVRNLSKTFPGQRALADVDLDVFAGEIHGLVGQNGSGKSTLVKVLAGYHQPDPGADASLRGAPFDIGSAAAARAAGVRFVHQDLGLVEALSITDNFHLADLDDRSLAKVRRTDERAEATAALAALGYALDADRPVGALAESERTAVALARALADLDQGPALLVLDEVTAALPGAEAERLFEALRRVADAGVAILFISHHLDEVLGLTDRVTVLRDGRRIATVRADELSHDGLVELVLGRQLLIEAAAAAADREVAETVLRARGLSGATVTDLDLDVAAGEIVGIAGLTGSGREEVAGLLAGRLPRSGTVHVRDRQVDSGDPHAAIRAGMCLVPADRAAHALLLASSMRENMTLPDVSAFWSGGVLRRGPERSEVARWIGELDVTPADGETVVATLSGGNQQKVVMARWLRVAPDVLVLDEPSQGVDVGSKADLHRLVDGAADAGAAVVVCSTDSEELARLADRVVVLVRGRIARVLTSREISVERIEELQLASVAAASIATSQPGAVR